MVMVIVVMVWCDGDGGDGGDGDGGDGDGGSQQFIFQQLGSFVNHH